MATVGFTVKHNTWNEVNAKPYQVERKFRVATSRYKAALSVNKELILLYHYIGTEILKSQNTHGWGAKIIDQLSHSKCVTPDFSFSVKFSVDIAVLTAKTTMNVSSNSVSIPEIISSRIHHSH